MASSWVDVWGTEANEDGLGEGFVSGVWEGGHGLSLMFQRGLLFFYSIFFSSISLRFASNRIIEISNSAPALWIVIKRISLWQFRLRVTHHAFPPQNGQGMHRAPTEPRRNPADSLLLTVLV